MLRKKREDYYPFGLTFNSFQRVGNKVNRFKYNGKEEQELTEWLDYGARMYMPDLGRWGVVDPLAEKYYSISPYVYVADNPIYFVDPNGMEAYSYNWEKKRYEDESGEEVDWDEVNGSFEESDFENNPRKVVGMLTTLLKEMGKAQGEIDFKNDFIPKEVNPFDWDVDSHETHSEPTHNTYDPQKPSANLANQYWTDVTSIFDGDDAEGSVELMFLNPSRAHNRDIRTANWREGKSRIDDSGVDANYSYMITFWSTSGTHQIAALSFGSFEKRKAYISNVYDLARLKTYNAFYNQYIRPNANDEQKSKHRKYNKKTYTPSRR